MAGRLAILCLLLVAGCLNAADSSGLPSLQPRATALLPRCPDPCERAVATGPEKSFEPDVAVNPLDSAHVVIAETPIHADPAGLALRSLAVHVSRDAGATWTTTWDSRRDTALPPHPLAGCLLLGDAVSAFLPDGALLVGGMVGVTVGTLSAFVMRSDDGGNTFPNVYWVDRASPGANCGAEAVPSTGRATESTDKPDLAAGPDGTVAFSWHKLGAEIPGGPNPNEFVIAFSADGGKGWSTPQRVGDGGSIGGSMKVLSRMHVEMAHWEGAIQFAATRDGGSTWELVDLGAPNNNYPSFAVAQTPNGTARLIGYHRATASGGEPTLAVSSDEGRTWTETPMAPSSSQYAMVALDADEEGNVFISYWKTTQDSQRITREVRLWRHSALSEPVSVDRTPAQPHDMTPIGYGHYQGLAAFPGGAYAAWGAGPPAAADLFAARIVAVNESR